MVTCTSADPGAPAGVLAVICVALTTVTFVAEFPPINTAAPVRNPVPVIVTVVPPATGPEFGVKAAVIIGGWPARKLNPPTSVPVWPSGFLTVMFTVPTPPLAVTATMCVELTKVVEAAAIVPNVTVAPFEKLVPSIVTEVPPAVGPDEGDAPVTTGPGTNEKPLTNVAV